MFELLVPPEKAQLDKLKGDKKAYDRELRPRLMVERDPASSRTPASSRICGRSKVSIGARIARRSSQRPARRPRPGRLHRSRPRRGRSQSARSGSRSRPAVPGFIGFAVGRTTFWDPLVAWRSKKATREQAVAEIAGRYREFVDLFERAAACILRSVRPVRPEHRSSMEG